MARLDLINGPTAIRGAAAYTFQLTPLSSSGSGTQSCRPAAAHRVGGFVSQFRGISSARVRPGYRRDRSFPTARPAGWRKFRPITEL